MIRCEPNQTLPEGTVILLPISGILGNLVPALTGGVAQGQVTGPSPQTTIPLPKMIERYPCAVFADKMALGQVEPFEIVIKSSLNMPYGQAIKITTKPGDQVVPILVTIETEPGIFEFVGDYYDTLLVPVGPEDSKPVVFNLKAKREGYHIVTAKFFQGIPIGRIEMGVLVVASKIDSPLTRQTIAQRINSRGFPTEPDLTLIIHEKNSQNFEYDIFLLSSDVPWKKIGDIAFRSDPETKFRAIFQDIEGKKMPANVIDRSIKSKGLSLYTELVPLELKNLYWTIRDKIRTVQVISEEPWIPWEIIKPWRKQGAKVEEDMFLCERYVFSRWQEGVEVKEKNQIYNVKVVVPHDTDLAGAKQESDWIQKLGTEKRFPVTIDSAYEEVMLSLEQGGFDLLHISTHGRYEQIDPNLSNIKLQDGLYLRAEDISGNATGFGLSNPLIILNACQTGSQGLSNRHWRLGTTILRGWCKLINGTLWSINDQSALRFSQELYSKLLNGAVLGEAVREARIACRQRGDPSWLAYTLYGRPNHSIKLGYDYVTSTQAIGLDFSTGSRDVISCMLSYTTSCSGLALISLRFIDNSG